MADTRFFSLAGPFTLQELAGLYLRRATEEQQVYNTVNQLAPALEQLLPTFSTLRSTDFPSGLTDKDSLDRLFQILNPLLSQLQTITTQGHADVPIERISQNLLNITAHVSALTSSPARASTRKPHSAS